MNRFPLFVLLALSAPALALASSPVHAAGGDYDHTSRPGGMANPNSGSGPGGASTGGWGSQQFDLYTAPPPPPPSQASCRFVHADDSFMGFVTTYRHGETIMDLTDCQCGPGTGGWSYQCEDGYARPLRGYQCAWHPSDCNTQDGA